MTITQQTFQQRRNTKLDDYDRTLFDRVREEVDLRKLLPSDTEAQEFDRYLLVSCLSPDHQDDSPSMLVYPDQARCLSCGYKLDAVELYWQSHQDLTRFECAEELLKREDLRVGEDTKFEFNQRERTNGHRKLDPEKAISAHLRLMSKPRLVRVLEQSGFERKSIIKFRLGFAETLVPLRKKDPTPEDVQYLNDKPYQLQKRFTVPVFQQGQLKQIIYRKSSLNQLGPKTILEKNAGIWLFNQDVLADTDWVVVTSGWGDAITLDQWNIPAVCSINGDGNFTADWYNQLRKIRRVFFVTDADQAGEQFRERFLHNIPWSISVDLDFEVGTKKDIRDWAKKYGRDDFIRLLRESEIRAKWKILTRKD